MRDSTKIKYFTIVGTSAIIFTSYMLHAKTYYASLEPTKLIIEKKVEKQKKIENVKQIEKIKIVKVVPKIKPQKILKIEEVKVKEPKPIELTKTTIKKKEIQTKRYIYLSSNHEVTNKAKKTIKNLLLKEDKLGENYYIEVEGYSASEIDSTLSWQLSKDYAENVAIYLRSIVEKRVIVIGYSDKYPIIADRFDDRNSRVELKFRKVGN